MRSRMMKIIVAVLAGMLFLAGCTEGNSSQKAESESRQQGYDALVDGQPGKTMNYSPTRETINFWVETWDEPGKLAYVYLQSATGDMIGYYVLEGLPVSMCAAVSPTYEVVTHSYGNVVVPAPANDGAYYSGGQCDTYYGKDATTGTYLEYTAGTGINVLLFEEPVQQQAFAEAQPLGPTSTDQVDE